MALAPAFSRTVAPARARFPGAGPRKTQILDRELAVLVPVEESARPTHASFRGLNKHDNDNDNDHDDSDDNAHDDKFILVAPIARISRPRRFTLQGWYADPCHFEPPHSACVAGAMQRLQAQSTKESLNVYFACEAVDGFGTPPHRLADPGRL